ncbi:MAG: betaine-aldehyde dehydrogenase, partial [Ilumatobacteraceae bacterium]
ASHYIGGRFVESDGPGIESRYPATGEVIAQLRSADDATIDVAIATARSAQTEWASWSAVERSRVLRRAADLLRERNRELSVLETLDTGKPLQETLVADATSGADCLEHVAGVIATETSDHIALGGGRGDSFAYTLREPLGVCVGIGAWNYPIQIACWKSAPALGAGNAMVFKPSEVTPLSALALAEIYTEAGVPPGVFGVVQGRGDVGAALVAHDDVAKVSVTGSVGTGERVAAGAAVGMKHVTLELGGKSPLIVFDDAHLDNAISGAMLANFYSAGQVCSNGTRVFVHRGVHDEFLDRLRRRTESIVLGDPLDEATQMGPLVNESQYRSVLDHLATGHDEGARCVTGGAAADVPGLENGWFVQPTVFADVTDDMCIAREEIFGPVMCVLPFDDEDEVIGRANDTQFGLAAGVFTRDISRGHRVIAGLEAGTCWINTYNLTPVSMPFGGYKRSGIGRENGRLALDHYRQVKSVYVELGDVEAPY